jgi:outer membrane protein assembly factor BamB
LGAVLAVLAVLPLIEATARPALAAVPVPQFAAGVEHSLGVNAASMAIADFTGDGRKDVIANPAWSQTGEFRLTLAAQQPDGSFQSSQLDMVPWTQQYQTVLAAGDIDGDGQADVAVPTDAGIKIFLQRNGGLAPALDTALPGTRRVQLADLDTDGRLDLLTSGTSGAAWLRGEGDGTFGVPASISPFPQMRVHVGHFNRDGRPDLVGVSDRMYVFRQRADGTFDTQPVTGFGNELAVGDLTGDGLDDIASTGGSSAVVWRQRPDGTLAPAVLYPAAASVRGIVIADVNGDGRKDAMTARDGARATGVMPQDTDGTLTTERLFLTPYQGTGEDQLFVDDITGDGRPDMVLLGAVGFGVLRGLAPLPPATTSTTSTTSTSGPGPTTTTSTTAPRPVSPDEATSWQMDAAHSGASTGGQQRPPLAERWARDLGGTVSYPLIAGGRVFALAKTPHGSLGSTLFALDAVTGRDLWGPIDLGARALFAYGAGQVFVVNNDHVLRSFDAATGRLRWIVTASSDSPPVFKDGVLYLQGAHDSTGGLLIAIDPADGHLLWSRSYPYPWRVPSVSGPAVGDGMVFTSSFCSPNVAWQVGTGDPIWATPGSCFSQEGSRTPVLGAGLVWLRSIAGSPPQARDPRTGAVVTTFTADVAPAFDATQGYFLEFGGLEARQPRTQEVLWRFTGDGRLTAAPIVVNGYVYTASASGQVWALDAATGAVAWSANAGAPVLPPEEGDNALFVAMAAGQGIVAVPATNRLVAYASAPAGPPQPITTPTPSSTSRPPFSASASEETSGFRGDASHQSNVVTNTIDGPPMRKRWTRDLGHPIEYSVVADGTMFVTAGPKLFALDLLTGQDRWAPVVLGPEGSRAHLAYGGGRVFAGAFFELPLRAFDADTGQELWSAYFTEYWPESFTSPAVYNNGLVYALTSKGVVRALSAATGEQVWKASSVGLGAVSPPTVSGGLVTVASCQTGGHALNAATGALVWKANAYCIGGAAPQSAVSAGELWSESTRLTPLVHDAATGKLIGASSGMLPAFDDRRTYSMEGTALKARDRSTMSTQWTFLGDGTLATPPLVVNNRIYIAEATGRLWVLDTATGAPVWSDNIGLPVEPRRMRADWEGGTNIVAGQGIVAVPATNVMVAYEPVPGPGGGYRSLQPARLLDTRTGLGAPQAKVGPGASLALQVTGRGGVPAAGVSAVALNVTVTAPTAESFLTVWPTGQARPLASNLNYLSKQTVPNMVVVKVGQGGKVSLFNYSGSTDLVVDVAGWYGLGDDPEGARYSPLVPARLLDTRTPGAPAPRLGPAATASLQVTGRGGVPESGVTAVALNVTVTGPTAESFLTAWPAGQTRPLASNLNYMPNQTVPNMVIVKVGEGGMVNLFNYAGSTDVVVDVAGWYGTEGARYRALAPTRILDTRIALGSPAAKVAEGSTLAMQVTGRGGVPAAGVSAVALNVTVTGPTALSFLTAWPHGDPRPLASNLNYTANQTVPNMVIVKVGAGGMVDLFNYLGATDVIVDVAGWYGP